MSNPFTIHLNTLKNFAQESSTAAKSSSWGTQATGMLSSVTTFGSSIVDLEAGTLDTDALMGKAGNVMRAMGDSAKAAGVSVKKGASSAATAVSDVAITPAQIRTAIGCFVLGAIFLCGAFVFLPMIVFAPQKFALLFTLGSIAIVSGVASLRNPKIFILSLMERPKLPFSLLYLGSMFLTIYASIILRSYIITMLAIVCQIGSLVHFVFSYVPGGTRFLKLLTKIVSNVCRLCWKAVNR
eukprot:GEMP01037792.1.p1 GENE.GEMP01037792.1~~GEMP01037792.1.p1  ORF type:complete len:254 (+),score=33.34 GEMP01037792.1:43-762(+)